MIFRGVPYIIENGVRIYDCPQRSEAWDRLRAGIPTTSDFPKIMTPVTCKPSTQAKDYAIHKVAEIFLQRHIASKDFYSPDIDHGKITEDSARMLYEMTYKVKARQVGFITDENHWWGCSPDSLIGEDGDLEIKCPKANTHTKYLLFQDELKKDYNFQAQGRMMIHGRKWCDLYSYHHEMPPVRIRCERDEEYIGKLSAALHEFRNTMNSMVESLIAHGHLKV